MLSYDTSGCSCISSRCRHPRTRCLRVGVCRCPGCARLCVFSFSRLSSIVVLLFCMWVTRGIHSLFAAALLLLLLLLSLLLCAERLFARAWRRCVSRCDVRDRHSVAGRYLWAVWLCRCRRHSHTVLCVSDGMQCADWRSFDLIRLMRCDALRCDALRAAGWGSAAASGAMV